MKSVEKFREAVAQAEKSLAGIKASMPRRYGDEYRLVPILLDGRLADVTFKGSYGELDYWTRKDLDQQLGDRAGAVSDKIIEFVRQASPGARSRIEGVLVEVKAVNFIAIPEKRRYAASMAWMTPETLAHLDV